MDSWDLRAKRRRHGLTLRSLARAAGTAETNLSAYERGTKIPNARTVGRLETILAAGSQSPLFTRNLLTTPAAAAAIRSGLRQGWSTADLLRIVRELRANRRELVTDADRAAFLAEPSTTGDQRWDAMLAGNAEDIALKWRMDPPAWTRGHALPQFWFVGSMPEFQAYSFAYSPMSMQVRGVMVDPADLESI